jgi:hypothetical protein
MPMRETRGGQEPATMENHAREEWHCRGMITKRRCRNAFCGAIFAPETKERCSGVVR